MSGLCLFNGGRMTRGRSRREQPSEEDLKSSAFDGRKVRSALKWRLLATLLGRVAAPVAAAELYEFVRTGSSRNLGEWVYRVNHPSHVYVYLYRMAVEGLVALHRDGAALSATLTERGRGELKRYSTYWRSRGIDNPQVLARNRRGGGARGREEKPVRSRLPGLSRSRSPWPRPRSERTQPARVRAGQDPSHSPRSARA